MKISLNISHAFHNKELRPGYTQAAFGDSFEPCVIELDELVKHITSGGAFTLGYFKSNRRTRANFISSQLLALDLDKCPLSTAELAADPFIRDHAYLIYPTPSHTPEKPKHRVLFVLSEPIEGQGALKRWETYQKGLLLKMAYLQPDEACKDGARLFFGSEKKEAVIK